MLCLDWIVDLEE